MEAVVALAERQQRGEQAVARRRAAVVARRADHVGEGVDAERGLQHHHGAQEPGDEQPTPWIVPCPGDGGRQQQAGADRHDRVPTVLEPDAAQRPQVGEPADVGGGHSTAEQPADVCEPDAARDRVRVVGAVRVGVVGAVVGGPRDGRVLEARGTEHEHGAAHRGRCAVGAVGEQTVVAGGHREAAGDVERRGEHERRPRVVDEQPDHADRGTDVQHRQADDGRPAQPVINLGGGAVGLGSSGRKALDRLGNGSAHDGSSSSPQGVAGVQSNNNRAGLARTSPP